MKFNKLIPELAVTDMKKSLDFYTKILRFKVEYAREKDKFAFLSLQGAQIMIQEKNGVWETAAMEKPFGRGINFQIEVKDIRGLLERLKKSKCKLFLGLKDSWYEVKGKSVGNREFLVQDSDGYLIRFFQEIKE